MASAAWVTIPVAASAEMKARCRSGVIELRRGAGWRNGAKPSSGSSASGGSPSNAVQLVRRDGREDLHRKSSPER